MPTLIDPNIHCTLDWCDRPRRTRGLCGMHYARHRKGKPLDTEPRIIGDLGARFWAKVSGGDVSECWLWTASLNDAGYGQFMIDGIPRRAHRIAYELMRCEIPEGLALDHLCRVRSCVNPWHVEPVTNAVNSQRAVHPTRPPAAQCKHGHDYTPENTRIDTEGYRRCRTCERRDSLAGYYRRKAKAAA